MSSTTALQMQFEEHASKMLPDDVRALFQANRLVPEKIFAEQKTTLEPFAKPKNLGISNYHAGVRASYYVGATWIIQGKLSATVSPKIKNLDFFRLFAEALATTDLNASHYFSKCYGIDYQAPEIEVDSTLNIITPLIIMHFIAVLKTLATHGLKRGYIQREENLKAKIKGRLLFPKHLHYNVISQREDRAYCVYPEYTEDIPENRLLKKALNYSRAIFSSYQNFFDQEVHEDLAPLQSDINLLLSRFGQVSDQVSTSEVQKSSANKLFREYGEAIRLAKEILRHHDYSFKPHQSDKKCLVHPFWINMPLLFELFVLNRLTTLLPKRNIRFQINGYHHCRADFGIERYPAIIDAKYKSLYASGPNRTVLDDIREISGYARDEKILRELKLTECKRPIRALIIYPDQRLDNNFGRIQRLTRYMDFYKVGIRLPEKS